MEKIVITTAHNMSHETYAFICGKLKEKYAQAELIHRYDDSIIGGFILNVDGIIHDVSIRERLRQMESHISE